MFKLHIFIFVGRIILLFLAIILYVQGQLNFTELERPLTRTGVVFSIPRHSVGQSQTMLPSEIGNIVFLIVVWVTLVIGMLGRIIPNKFVTTGAGKHFRPDRKAVISHRGVLAIAVTWLILNTSLILVLRQFDLFNTGIAIIIALIYSVCDVAFILFYCPFQKLFMHNKCCATCRIYNWDFFMTCTPLIPFLHIYSISLVLLSVIVLIRWEVAIYKKSYSLVTDCADCRDKMCYAKRKIL